VTVASLETCGLCDTAGVTFKLIFAPEPDLFEQRLNRFVADLGENVVIGQLQYSTVVLPSGEVMYSAIIGFKRAQGWDD
jgi:hypothetical protein